ncbi:hypothetical protein GR198_29590 [Rhizobium leguminosarum]|uniref:hypothetical protein n=1 Tax=Rhizobium leguminosarum TaxID=384 RepID=UPI0013C16DFA|nr:hypothetical protein [Rhizobium leguminosarum]NEH59873.1 hypothetical protein [Rhizobium leguminosarum]
MMVYTQHDWIRAVSKLTELTSKQQIKWDVAQQYEDVSNEKVDKAYEAKHQKNRYVLKQVQRQEWYDSGPEDYAWSGPYYALEIYQHVNPFQEDLVTTAPSIQIVRELFNKVQSLHIYRLGVLDDLLKSDDSN